MKNYSSSDNLSVYNHVHGIDDGNARDYVHGGYNGGDLDGDDEMVVTILIWW